MSHVPFERLDPGGGHALTAAERAHLEQCPKCRIDRRMLRAPVPGIADDAARRALDALRSRAGAAMSDAVHRAIDTFGDTGWREVRWHRASALGAVYRAVEASGARVGVLVAAADRATEDRVRAWVDAAANTRVRGVAMPQLVPHRELVLAWAAPDGVRAVAAWATGVEATGLFPTFARIGAALERLHAAGLVHGHVGPATVVVDGSGGATLVEPGLWGDAEPRTPADDWRGFGALIAYALTGVTPGPGDPVGDDAHDTSPSLATLADGLLGPSPPVPSEIAWALAEAGSGRTDYTDLGLLGRGGMAEIRRVRDANLRRTVALKTLRPELAARPHAERHFLAEAQVTAQLQHPGIVPVHDLGRLGDGRPYFTMQEIAGQTLADAIRAERPFRRLVDIVRRVCETVAYAHGRGVLHRDLKPSNVMVGAHGEVRVLDWGLLRIRDDDEVVPEISTDAGRTRTGTVKGTPAYMAPEQATGGPIGVTTDVYALGAILYEVLAGCPPYRGTRSDEVIADVIAGPPPPITEAAGRPLPEALVAVCERAMARDPADRYPSADAVGAAIAAWLDGVQREERAREEVDAAEALVPGVDDLRERARALREEASAILAATRSYEADTAKIPGWRLEDEADALDLEAELRELDVEQRLYAAFAHAPLTEAHAALARRFRTTHAAAEHLGDRPTARRAEARMRAHVDALPADDPERADHLAYLTGTGAVSLVTDPPGAEVTLYRFVERDRRLVEEPVRSLGRTPLREIPLAPGSYLLVIEAEGRVPVRYPVAIGRSEHWHGVRPGDSEPHPVHLPAVGELGPDDCYVPAGWTWVGGDPEAANCGPLLRVWIDGFVIDRYPCTQRAYLAFLNDLVDRGEPDEAFRWAVKRTGATREAPDTLLYVVDADGHYGIDPGTEVVWGELWPVYYIDYACSHACARWRSSRDGHPWRPPMGYEWEKAGRGVDRRAYPWGDFAESSWYSMRTSRADRPMPCDVTDYPVDVSLYGVRHLAGLMTNWCLDIFATPEPLVDDRLVVIGADDDDNEPMREWRGGNWYSDHRTNRLAARGAYRGLNRNTSHGFRLVRSVG